MPIDTKTIDLPAEAISRLIEIFAVRPEIEKVVVFGSRSLGNAKPGSDIDLAFFGPNLSRAEVARIQGHLEEETTLPWFFDCVHFETTGNGDLRQHIEQYGKILYEKPIETTE